MERKRLCVYIHIYQIHIALHILYLLLTYSLAEYRKNNNISTIFRIIYWLYIRLFFVAHDYNLNMPNGRKAITVDSSLELSYSIWR